MQFRHFLSVTFLVVASAFINPAFAAVKTVTLDVPGMYCAVCPITVKKALEKVPGVAKAKATLEKKEAVVTYDDAKTNIEKLLKATADAGYPATIKGTVAK